MYFGQRKLKTNNSDTEIKVKRKAAVYKRFSTYEQVHSSRYSLVRQDALLQNAINDGYRATLTDDDIRLHKESPQYPGYYWDGDILVIDIDMGISGAKGQDKRPGLALLIEMIKADLIETIYTIDITRLFRDQHLIDSPTFAKLCQEHNVIIMSGE
jgi:DNA invertase Pin-like site-specific DNA recombinase